MAVQIVQVLLSAHQRTQPAFRGSRKGGMSRLCSGTCNSPPVKAGEDARILDPDGYKRRLDQMWRSRAPKYDVKNDFHPPLCEALVTLAEVGPGARRVLDAASGTGFVALSAAKALGPDGLIVANDISEPMLTQVKQKAGEAGVNIECHLHDIETARFPQGSFDRILCSNGMAYLQQPHATLQKFHLWLAAGGRLCFNNPLVPMVPLTDIIRRLAADLFDLEYTDAAAVFGTPEAIRSSCEAAGFTDIKVTASQELRTFINMMPEEYASMTFNSMVNFPTSPLVDLLTPKQLQQLRAAYMPEATAMAKEMQTSDGSIALHYTMQWAVAVA